MVINLASLERYLDTFFTHSTSCEENFWLIIIVIILLLLLLLPFLLFLRLIIISSIVVKFYFFHRWELSEEESGGSDVETLVNQQSAVSLMWNMHYCYVYLCYIIISVKSEVIVCCWKTLHGLHHSRVNFEQYADIYSKIVCCENVKVYAYTLFNFADNVLW